MADLFKDVEYSIRQKIENLRPIPGEDCKPSIYKVPQPIRNVKKGCYEPLVVSIGPFYYKKKNLKPLQELKLRHLQCFLQTSIDTPGCLAPSVGQYIETIGQKEQQVRSCYSEEVKLPRKEFIEMLMVDAAFIIYLFMWPFMWPHEGILFKDFPIQDKLEVLLHIQHDLFLEENQIPFFVLNVLYEMAFGAAYPHISFKDLTLNFIKCSGIFGNGNNGNGNKGTLEVEQKLRNVSEIKHLVDILRILCLPSKSRDQLPTPTKKISEYPPTAKELKAAGVKFVVAPENTNLLDINFSKSVLEIPKLLIVDSTESIFRSILIFENCCHFSDTYFLDYLIFLDNLIDTPEDVHILVESKIIKNCLGSEEEVAKIINTMVKGIMLNNTFFYVDVSQRLNEHYSQSWNRWRAILEREYFSHPWSIISVIYLVVLLILTVMQVFTGFKQLSCV